MDALLEVTIAIKVRCLVEIDMKFSQVLTSVALAAAAVSASAATVTINGSSSPFALLASSATINFSNDATALDTTNVNYSNGSSVISAFGIANIALTASGTATVINGTQDYTDYTTSPPTTGQTAATIGVSAGVTQLTATTSGTVATIANVQSTGGVTQTAAKSQVSNGGNITIGNLFVDFANPVSGVYSIYGDVSGANGLTAHNEAVFTFTAADVVGSTSFDTASLAAGQSVTLSTQIKHLGLTSAAQADIIKGLALKSGLGQNTLKGLTDFGWIDSQVTIKNVAAVPEPSTYALMGVGLAFAGMVARRRSAK